MRLVKGHRFESGIVQSFALTSLDFLIPKVPTSAHRELSQCSSQSAFGQLVYDFRFAWSLPQRPVKGHRFKSGIVQFLLPLALISQLEEVVSFVMPLELISFFPLVSFD